jgi:glucose/arabinose dehydrogenase
MAFGEHRLELAVVRETDGVASAKSPPLDLLVVPTRGGGATPSGSSRLAVTAADGTDFVVETLATGLDTPSGLAITPDGRVLIAERSGDVRVWQNGKVLPEPAVRLRDAAQGADVGLLGIALHPDFSQNGQVFLLYTARSGDGTFANRVVRYREVNNVFGQAAVILEDAVAEPPQRTPRIRFGRDRKLYLALPAGTDRSVAEDPASYVGKILRINDDGTTPRDNPGYSPVISDGHRAPVGFDWHPISAQLWVGEHNWDDRDQLSLVGSPGNDGSSPLQRSRDRTAFSFDSEIDPSGASFYAATAIDGFKNDLFIAALSGQHIRRVRFDPLQPSRVISTERLLDHQLGRISDILLGGHPKPANRPNR